MIDIGLIPPIVMSAVAMVDSETEAFITEISDLWWPDKASGVYLEAWERFFKIIPDVSSSVEYRREVVMYWFNAQGGVHTDWFYALAERAGWYRNRSPLIELIDGQFLPFRTGISQTGDLVYDNVVYGAMTGTIRYESRGAVEDSVLKSVFGRCRSLGTVFLWETI